MTRQAELWAYPPCGLWADSPPVRTVSQLGERNAHGVRHSDLMPSNTLPLPSDAAAVSSRDELAAYVTRIQTAIEAGAEVQNDTLDRFLEALAGKLEAQPPGSGEASWSYFAYVLSAALIYD